MKNRFSDEADCSDIGKPVLRLAALVISILQYPSGLNLTIPPRRAKGSKGEQTGAPFPKLNFVLSTGALPYEMVDDGLLISVSRSRPDLPHSLLISRQYLWPHLLA
jgi:hypothetical protein